MMHSQRRGIRQTSATRRRGACDSLKGTGTQAELVAALQQRGIR